MSSHFLDQKYRNFYNFDRSITQSRWILLGINTKIDNTEDLYGKVTDKIKRSFFQAAVTSILLYGCTTWTLTKRLEKKLDGNYIRMLRAILNKSWQQHPTRHQLYGHLPPITKTIQVRRTRHARHCWRSRDELIRDVLLWIPTHSRAKAGRPARTYIQQLCEDTGCCPEDLPRAMNDREEWWERVRDIRATSAIWWWWCVWDIYIYIYIYQIGDTEENGREDAFEVTKVWDEGWGEEGGKTNKKDVEVSVKFQWPVWLKTIN